MANSDALLLLNAAEGLLQIGLAGDGRDLLWRETPAAGQGAERLLPALRQMLGEAGLQPGDISRIACVRGPGSFTGLRLVLSTAFGLARARAGGNGPGPLLAGIDYLPLLAAAACSGEAGLAPRGLAAVWVLTHARRGQVHMQGFSGQGRPLGEPEAQSTAGAIATIRARHGPEGEAAGLLGSGLERNGEEISVALPQAVCLPPEANRPSPAAFLRAARAAAYGREPIAPLYLRPSDAEENLPGIAAGLGLDPTEAALALRRLRSRVDISRVEIN